MLNILLAGYLRKYVILIIAGILQILGFALAMKETRCKICFIIFLYLWQYIIKFE